MTPMGELLNHELWEAWTAGRIGWATLCPEDGLPNACHNNQRRPAGEWAEPEEKRYGIPTGTFMTIRALWRDDWGGPMPRRWR